MRHQFASIGIVAFHFVALVGCGSESRSQAPATNTPVNGGTSSASWGGEGGTASSLVLGGSSSGGGSSTANAGTSGATPELTNTPIPNTAFFVNVGIDCYWCGMPTFVDLVRAGECWRSGYTECVNGVSSVPLDADGWPRSVPTGDVARIALGPIQRTGTYVVRWQGKGKFSLVSPDGALENTLDVTATGGQGETTLRATGKGVLTLELSATDASDRLRAFSIIHQDLAANATAQPFYPETMAYLRPFAGLRFMDWLETNNNTQVNWSDRVPSYAYNATTRYETAIQLCNLLHRHCWLNVPAMANDDYMRSLATLVKSSLDPTLKVYIEYTNEAWNFGFTQAEYCRSRGVALRLPGGDDYESGFAFYAQRSKELFDIFSSVFGTDAMRSRVVRVLAGQAVSTYLTELHLRQAGVANVDAYAIAPYFGYESNDGYGGAADNWSLDQLFARMTSVDLPAAVTSMKAMGQLLATNKISMIAYEGGQHLAGFAASTRARSLYEQAQTDSRLYDLYQNYFDAWKASGGQLFAYYSAVGPISGEYGSWGLKPTIDTPDAQTPKHRGLVAWNSKNPRWW